MLLSTEKKGSRPGKAACGFVLSVQGSLRAGGGLLLSMALRARGANFTLVQGSLRRRAVQQGSLLCQVWLQDTKESFLFATTHPQSEAKLCDECHVGAR